MASSLLSSSLSESDFEGFTREEVRKAEQNCARINKEQLSDISDIDFTDVSDEEGDSDSDSDTEIATHDDCVWSSNIHGNFVLRIT